MKKLSILFGAFFLTAVAAAQASAEWRGQADGLFWLDMPDGWIWTEEKGGVTVSELDGSDTIAVRFEKIQGAEGSGRDLVTQAWENRRREVAERNGKSVMKVERRIDGVFALQTGFLISTSAGIRQATSVVFFNKGYLFDIYFDAPREIFRLEMEKIVDTWRFEKPEEPKEKDETAAASESPDAQPQGGEDVS
jgi:hypothetical protein